MKNVNSKHSYFPFYLLLIWLFFDYIRPQVFFPIIGVFRPAFITFFLLLFYLHRTHNIYNFKNIQTKLFMGILLLMMLHGPFAVNRYNSYHIWKLNIFQFIVYMSMISFIDSPQKIKRYVNIWILVNFFCAIIGIKNGGRIPHHSFIADPNDFSLAMNVAIPFAYFMFLETISIKKKIYYIVAMGTFVSAVIITDSRGGFVGLIPVLFYCWYKTPKKIMATGVIIFIICAACFVASPQYWRRIETIKTENIDEGTGGIRWRLWQAGLNMFLHNPVIGVGQGNYTPNIGKYHPGTASHEPALSGRVAHSSYITLISELGLVGLMLYSGILFYSIRDLRRILRVGRKYTFRSTKEGADKKAVQGLHEMKFVIFSIFGAMIGYLVSGTFVSVLYYPHLFLLIGLSVAVKNTAEKSCKEIFPKVL